LAFRFAAISASASVSSALENTPLNRAGGDQLGFEAIARAQRIQRVKRGHRLGHTGGRLARARLMLFQRQAGFHIHDRKGHRATKLRLLDQALGPGRRPLTEARRAPFGAQRNRRRIGTSRSAEHRQARGQENASGKAFYHGGS
jgi:hypothetical protein